MQLPEKLLQSLQEVEGFDREAFEQVHAGGERVTSIRVNPARRFEIRNSKFEFHPVPWCQFGYYLKERPSFTFDPLFHAGCYYVQEASGMFLEQVLKQTLDLSKPITVLDISAAPGGKSTHVQSLVSKDSLVVSNEVIKTRARVLQENIVKWGSNNVVVTSSDPKKFGRIKNFFDVVIADAPCSGSGLFRRDERAVDEWSENNVQLCSQRQQRILADVWPALKKGGLLVYSTCSYSKEEDEDILDWLMNELSAQSVVLRIEEGWNIDKVQSRSGATAYRFWPYKVRGEGLFIAALIKMDSRSEAEYVRGKERIQLLGERERKIVDKWANEGEDKFVKVADEVFAVSPLLLNSMNILSGNVQVIYFGTLIGEVVRDKLIPNHSLALSNLANRDIPRKELNYEDAIDYLKKKNMKGVDGGNKGWQIVTYQDHPLGWINVLASRINNYYPKELRILKDI